MVADFHIHSSYSRATSAGITASSLARAALTKGLSMVGTGDCLHPKWLAHLKNNLTQVSEGVYEHSGIKFVVTGEVNSHFQDDTGKIHRIHSILILPGLDAATALADRLSDKAGLLADGRPTVRLPPAELVDELRSVDPESELVPAHVWTPWFSLFGVRGGFESLDQCFGERSASIHALETGLSSDPPMNWSISALDRYTLLSNSDAHSDHVWRIGREANIFSDKCASYAELVHAIRTGDGLLSTLEVPPAFGKYHWSGHRRCGVSLPPEESVKRGGLCPVCNRRMTLGVDERVHRLSNRPRGYVPKGKPSFRYTIPLHELLLYSYRSSKYTDPRVEQVYEALIRKYSSELRVVHSAPLQELYSVNPVLGMAIEKLRDQTLHVKPGYDGVYGVIDLG